MTPWVMRLLVANVALFLIDRAVPGLRYLLALHPCCWLTRPWTLLSYAFIHADFWHIFWNMPGLYFFGPRLEERLGGRHFILLYLASALSGAALSIILEPRAGVVGASGATFGVFLGFARYWPTERILVYGVIPVEARLLVLIMTLLSISGGFSGLGNTAHFAHLGGYVGGYLYLRWMEWSSPAKRFRRKVEGAAVISNDVADVRRWRTIRREDLHQINREEVERLLAKIQTSGVKSLTPDERACLDRFSKQ
jgi:membrane associated rhomboid family serine protease